jgi:hypothetical protein
MKNPDGYVVVVKPSCHGTITMRGSKIYTTKEKAIRASKKICGVNVYVHSIIVNPVPVFDAHRNIIASGKVSNA